MAEFWVKFEAEVNGTRRWVEFPMTMSVEEIAHRGMDGIEAEAELLIMNEQGLYNEFYEGAEPEDYDAELENVIVEVIDE
jgi:hypothetical protein